MGIKDRLFQGIAGSAMPATVDHNDFGPLSNRGWLAYINSHAGRESTRIK